MAYDFHLGKNREEASFTSRSFTLEDYDHDALFEEIEKFIDKKWIIFRMDDYFSNAKISLQEIPLLIKEINLIIPKISNKTNIGLLKGLENICEKSIKRNEDIYCFCD